MAVRSILCSAPWLARSYLGGSSFVTDLSLYLGAVLCTVATGPITLNRPEALAICCEVFLLAAIWAISYSGHRLRRIVFSQSGSYGQGASSLRPLIFPARTSHTRFFPKKHSFSYSYLFVGVPVVPFEIKTRALSVGTSCRPSWFHVKPQDYLDRGDPGRPLRGRLDDYLLSQKIDPDLYPFAYLVTAPKFLGYSFNPVSFWYLYSENKHLTAMILEVNNTFDERRMYFLSPQTSLMGTDNYQNRSFAASDSCFKGSWAKDFHVSPFNSREGSYSIVARHILPFINNDIGRLSNRITLTSSEGHKKLVAQAFSTRPVIDPATLSMIDLIRLVVRWSWTGFATFPRILRQAFTLYFKKRLVVWFRPEVNRGSIGRMPTRSETELEGFFFDYLKATIMETSSPAEVLYKPAGGVRNVQTFGKASECLRTPHEPIIIEVLSPAFYSRFIHYESMLDALGKESAENEPTNRTLHISQPEVLLSIISKVSCERVTRDAFGPQPTTATRCRWNILRRLRTKGTFSALDAFIMTRSGHKEHYRRLVCEQLLAKRLTFGFTIAIEALDLCLRLVLVYLGIHARMDERSFAVANPSDLTESKILLSLLRPWFSLTGIHIWAFIKGG